MTQNDRPDQSDATDTIVNVSAQISHDLVGGAKDRVNELAHLPIMVFRFLRNPFRFIRNCPDLKTVTWVVLAVAGGVAGALVNGMLFQSPFRFFLALLILPMGSFLAVFATTSILRLVLQGAHGLRFRYRSGASIFAFANLFWWIPIGATDKFFALPLIGFFIALMIASVGFIAKLKLPRGVVYRWFAVLGSAHVIIWYLGKWIAS